MIHGLYNGKKKKNYNCSQKRVLDPNCIVTCRFSSFSYPHYLSFLATMLTVSSVRDEICPRTSISRSKSRVKPDDLYISPRASFFNSKYFFSQPITGDNSFNLAIKVRGSTFVTPFNPIRNRPGSFSNSSRLSINSSTSQLAQTSRPCRKAAAGLQSQTMKDDGRLTIFGKFFGGGTG